MINNKDGCFVESKLKIQKELKLGNIYIDFTYLDLHGNILKTWFFPKGQLINHTKREYNSSVHSSLVSRQMTLSTHDLKCKCNFFATHIGTW